MKNFNIYRVGIYSVNSYGGAVHLERAFAFEPELTEDEIKKLLYARLGRILSIEYVDEVEHDVIFW
ncbi:hypothetical protein [Enterococcus sp. 4E1_DIV0656]|uniref:hypothetical protein n=1 Tax=Enterococcus sp. 4E1_DIV0656 TaxID=1834180 RepID=UPI0011225BE0|nr:hypothetical protein [Enterococcus sp. 4E1_DIV0656]